MVYKKNFQREKKQRSLHMIRKIKGIIKKIIFISILLLMVIRSAGIFARDEANWCGVNQLTDMKMKERLTNPEVELRKKTLERKEILIEKITPVLYVENIESCLGFWVDALGFVKTVELTEGDRLGFVILISGNTEIMLQTYDSVDKDIPTLGTEMRGAPAVLYIELKNIDEIEHQLKNYEVVVPRRITSYGAVEIFYRSPGGHIVGFAQQQ